MSLAMTMPAPEKVIDINGITSSTIMPSFDANASVLSKRFGDIGNPAKWVEIDPATDEAMCDARNAKLRRKYGLPENGPISYGELI